MAKKSGDEDFEWRRFLKDGKVDFYKDCPCKDKSAKSVCTLHENLDKSIFFML